MGNRFGRGPRFYVTPTETPIGDELERVCEGEIHRTSPPRRAGGEWDPWKALPRRTKLRLIGAGYARRGGLEPDVLADVIVRNKPDVADDPLGWYYRTALAALRERRSASRKDRRNRLARAAGCRTEYAYRTLQAQAAGFETFWQYRLARKWAERNTP